MRINKYTTNFDEAINELNASISEYQSYHSSVLQLRAYLAAQKQTAQLTNRYMPTECKMPLVSAKVDKDSMFEYSNRKEVKMYYRTDGRMSSSTVFTYKDAEGATVADVIAELDTLAPKILENIENCNARIARIHANGAEILETFAKLDTLLEGTNIYI